MAKIRSPELAQLLMQAQFAPERQRVIQLDACENLMRLIQPGRDYPYEFVCFHLTGYRPRTLPHAVLIGYEDLAHDLAAYSEQLSKGLNIPALPSRLERAYTIEQLAKRFGVCVKTINRWRQRGLIGRYLVFKDGRKRLAFLGHAVELFEAIQGKSVEQGRAFSQLGPQERGQIERRLVRWAHFAPDQRQEAIRRTAKRFGRSVETVRKLLADYEKSSEAGRLFVKRSTYIGQDQRAEIARLFEQGTPVSELMERFSKSKSNIYRAINMQWAAELAEREIAYMGCEEFASAGTGRAFLEPPAGLFEQTSGPVASEDGGQEGERARRQRPPAPTGLQAYVADIAQHDLLNARQEQFLFRKYNYLKWKAATLQEGLDVKEPRGRLVRQIRGYLEQAEVVKDGLIEANLRLVVSVARKHTRHEGEMQELISEGNMALMNAVEKFDAGRGVKFSTYATWAIVKRFATLRRQQYRRPVYAVEEEILEVAGDVRLATGQAVVGAVESARRSLTDVMDEALEERERVVVREHYGLTEPEKVPGLRKAKSFSEIAALVGLSKERVRQIELAALAKLRRLLTPEQFDVLTQG